MARAQKILPMALSAVVFLTIIITARFKRIAHWAVAIVFLVTWAEQIKVGQHITYEERTITMTNLQEARIFVERLRMRGYHPKIQRIEDVR